MVNRRPWKIICLIAGLLGIAGPTLAGDVYVDTIDPAVRHQTIEYFGASDCWTVQKVGLWSAQARSKMAELLFSSTKGIGLSGWRCNLMGGVDPARNNHSWKFGDSYETEPGKYDWSRSPGQRWFLSAAKAQGVDTFIAFCNSPPRDLTVNGLTWVDRSAGNLTSNLKPGMQKQFAVYLADILQHFRDNPDPAERINFRWVSPVNEPQWDWVGGQEGTRNSNQDILEQYQAIAAELRKRNLSTHILGPESGSIPDMYQPDTAAEKKHGARYGNYIDLFTSETQLAEPMDHCLGYHSYWSDDAGQVTRDRNQLRKKMVQHPDWRIEETEYCVMERKRDLTMAMALRAARIVQLDLTLVNATSWSWWTAVSNGDYKDGLIYTDYHRPGDVESVIPSKWLWAFGNFTRFIRPGMVRVEIKSTGKPQDLRSVMGSAYIEPGNRKIIAVYLNGSDQPAELNLQLPDHATVGWIPYITSDKPGDDLAQYPAIPMGQPITLPAKSVVTMVSEP